MTSPSDLFGFKKMFVRLVTDILRSSDKTGTAANLRLLQAAKIFFGQIIVMTKKYCTLDKISFDKPPAKAACRYKQLQTMNFTDFGFPNL